MRVIGLAAVVFLIAVSAAHGSSGAGAVPLKGSGFGSVLAISCPAPGECAAGGSAGGTQAYVVSETNGSWGKPVKVPGMASLNTGGNAGVVSISCPAAGDCSAGGFYSRAGHSGEWPFVVSETNGTWGNAIAVPGTVTRSYYGADAGVISVSCTAAGDCAAGGSYDDRSGYQQAFVVSETNGIWGNAIEMPDATVNTGGYAIVNSVSCTAAGECVAGGLYTDAKRRNLALTGARAFVVSETNGVWGKPINVPGMAALAGGDSGVESISCPAAGDCAAGGWYTDSEGTEGAFLVSETNGSWGNAIEVPGAEKLAYLRQAVVGAVACAAAGECAAGGGYPGPSSYEAFVVSETDGTWGNAIEVPGMADYNSEVGVESISCAAAGECAAAGLGGGDTDSQAFVVSETDGTWGKALEVPGTARLVGGYSAGISISCPAAGECAAGGYLSAASSGRRRPFVVSETDGTWGNAIPLRNLPVSCVVPNFVGQRIGGATAWLDDGNCEVGKITYVYSTVPNGRVVAEHPEPGKILRAGTRVAFVVSKGRKK